MPVRKKIRLKKRKKPLNLAVLRKIKPKVVSLKKIKAKKYEFYNKKLGLKNLKTRKKFIIAHIDGLSYELLQYCMDKRITPFIRKLTSDYNLTSYNCGLPSNTPSFQANVLYGSNKNIPGLNFFDKKR